MVNILYTFSQRVSRVDDTMSVSGLSGNVNLPSKSYINYYKN